MKNALLIGMLLAALFAWTGVGCLDVKVPKGPYVTTGGHQKTVGKQLLDLWEDYDEGDISKAEYERRRQAIIDECLNR